MLAKRDVAVRMAAFLLPGLLFACRRVRRDRGFAKRIGGVRATEAAARPSAIVNRPPPIFPRTCRRTQPLEREKRDRELDAKLQICRGC